MSVIVVVKLYLTYVSQDLGTAIAAPTAY